MVKLKAIISLSGGMDSATVLAEALSLDRGCLGVGFFYGSKHNKFENQKASQLADHYKIPFKLINVENIFKGFRSNLMEGGGGVPEGHYQNENMKLTVVPGRNLIFISILAGLAESLEAEEVWLGIHAGDHAIYPDCRPGFFENAKTTVRESSDQKIVLIAPFMKWNKTDILRRGTILNVPYNLTRTCYKNRPNACGKCGSCVERLEAFKALEIKDPIYYDERINT